VGTVYFITHPDVVIDPHVPVPEWPLNERGRARLRAMIGQHWLKGICCIFASDERKARDAAQILADALGLDGYRVVPDLRENDRSATGYLPKQEFEARPMRSLQTHTRGSAAGNRRLLPRPGLFEPSRRSCRKRQPKGIWQSWVMAVLERCCSVISLDCQSIGGMTSRRRTGETGSRSSVQRDSFCMTNGDRSMPQGNNGYSGYADAELRAEARWYLAA